MNTNERKAISALLTHLRKNGHEIKAIHDGDQKTTVKTKKQALDLIFNLDEAWLLTVSGHTILLNIGEGEDMIADWSFTDQDPDNFDEAMDVFLDKIERYF